MNLRLDEFAGVVDSETRRNLLVVCRENLCTVETARGILQWSLHLCVVDSTAGRICVVDFKTAEEIFELSLVLYWRISNTDDHQRIYDSLVFVSQNQRMYL